MNTSFPYGPDSTVSVDIPDANLLTTLEPPTPVAAPRGSIEEAELVNEALKAPIGSPRISDLARRRKRAAIVISDASRPNVESRLLPPLIEQLKHGGLRSDQIHIFVGGGTHRSATSEEVRAMLGPELYGEIRISSHNAAEGPLVSLGASTQGIPLYVNKDVYEADLKVVVGTLLPHPIAGYSGGGKGMTIGVGGAETVRRSHTPDILWHPRVGLGSINGNPFYEMCLKGALLAGTDFIVNAVVTSDERLVDVVAGHVEHAHRQLIDRTARPTFEVTFPEQADVVMVSAGHPKDTNLYHVAAEAISVTAGEASVVPCVKPGGTVIVIAPLNEGMYSEGMEGIVREAESPEEVLQLYEKRGITVPGQHRGVSLAKVLTDHRVVITHARCDEEVIRAAHLEPSLSARETLDEILSQRPDAKVLAVLNSHRLVPRLAE